MKKFFTGNKDATPAENKVSETPEGSTKDQSSFGSKIETSVANSIRTIVTGSIVEKVSNTITNKTQEVVESTQRFQVGIVVLIVGLLFVGLSFLFFPLIVISPYKFCALNSLGTATLLIALFIMRGRTFGRLLFSKARVLFTVAYLVSLVLEIYFSTVDPRYFFVIGAMVANVVSALYLALSSLPFGVKFLNTIFRKLFATLISGVSGGQGSDLPA